MSTARALNRRAEMKMQTQKPTQQQHMEELKPEGSAWPGSPCRERGRGSPEGSGAAPQPSRSCGLPAGSAHGCATQQTHIRLPALPDPLQLQAPGCPRQHVQKDAKRGICGKVFPSMDRFNAQCQVQVPTNPRRLQPRRRSCTAAAVGQGRLATQP